jgi:hypothetical protein
MSVRTTLDLVVISVTAPVVSDDMIELRRQLINQDFVLEEIRHLGLEGLRGLLRSLEPMLPQAA